MQYHFATPYRNLSNNQLGGVLPSNWISMTALKHLDLSNNTGVSGNLPSEWSSLTTLSEVKLQSLGSIAGTVPSEWLDFTALTKLDISLNPGLTGTIPELLHNRALAGLLDLKYDGSINLGLPRVNRTCIGGLDLYLPYIARKHGPGNQFAVECGAHTEQGPAGGTIPEWIGAVTGLTRLILFKNNMKGTLPAGLGLLTNMTRL
jgi:hypothetical protein